MENKVLEKNLFYIKKYNKNLADKILNSSFNSSNCALTKTNKDEYNLIYKNTLIHDAKGAIEESERIVSTINDINDSIRIVYGLGLGYLVDLMAQKIKKGRILVYEPNLDLLSFVLSIAQIDAIANDRVFIYNDESQFLDKINKITNHETTLSISFLNSYKNLFFYDIKKIFNKAQNILGEKIINHNTLINKSEEAISYSTKNLVNIIKNPPLDSIKNIYKGKTALILSAGPSLAKNLDLIKNNQDKFVVFAVNRVVNLLIENSICPNFVVNIESIDTLRQFRGIDTKKLCFILEGFTNPKIHALETKKTFNYLSCDNFLNPWIRECLKIDNNLKSIGTVTYSALSSACLMGFKKIILLGSDLAFQNGDCYSKTQGWYEELECVLEGEEYLIKPKNYDKFLQSFKNDKTKLREYLNKLNKNLCTVVNEQGKLIPSRLDYSFYINHLSNFILNHKNIDFINCSKGGALIKGCSNIDFSQVVQKLEKIEKIDLSNIKTNYDTVFIVKKIDSTIEILNKFINSIDNTKNYYQFKDNLILKPFIYKLLNSDSEKTRIKKSIEEIINNLTNCKSFIVQ